MTPLNEFELDVLQAVEVGYASATAVWGALGKVKARRDVADVAAALERLEELGLVRSHNDGHLAPYGIPVARVYQVTHAGSFVTADSVTEIAAAIERKRLSAKRG